jgi:exosortase
MDNQATTDIGILDQFQNEFTEFWHRLPNKGFFFVLLLCWLAVFQFFGNATFGYIDTPSLFRWMWTVYWSRDAEGDLSDDSTGLWVPILVLGLIWWKHKELMTLRFELWWPGLFFIVAGILLHIVGFRIQIPHVSIMALLVGIYGLMSLAWGWAWARKIWFPFFLLIFLVPLSRTMEPLTFRLRLAAMQIVEFICHNLLAIDVIREGTILKDPSNRFHYEVVAACGGIRSFIAIGLMATVGAFLFLQQWWRRGILLALIAPLAVIGNALRLLAIVIAADLFGQNAGNWVHEGGPLGLFSLLPYAPAIFGLIYIGQKLEEKKTPKSAT